MQTLELLAPAKNFEFGKVAIDAGADAVFIGGPAFTARVNASNSLYEIEQLVEYAHQFNAKVYVTFNTIIYDQELEKAQELIQDYYKIGVDALIVQDMGVLEMNLPPIPLFASTQCHNHTWEKVKFLEEVGFQRVILARELSLAQIQEIRAKTKVPLEAFVHGALCVSYSGQCYFSNAETGRSANRGECAQMCRLKYSLEDAEGKLIVDEKYLLSLKDFNLQPYLEELVEAGISSFKIEGRLKDLAYVKNITALYRQSLDKILEKKADFQKTSSGKIISDFTPNALKTFNRGYTDYFLHKRTDTILSPETQKSLGEPLGEVKSVQKNYFTLKQNKKINNGDGICYFGQNQKLLGVNINRSDGEKIYPREMNEIFVGTEIFRNLDTGFKKELDNSKTRRKIELEINVLEKQEGFKFEVKDEDQNQIDYFLKIEKEFSKDQARSAQNIQQQLSKMGETIFDLKIVRLNGVEKYFFPVSVLNELRRTICDLMQKERVKNYSKKEFKIVKNNYPYPQKEVDYHANVANQLAQKFYERHNTKVKEKAFELLSNLGGKDVMTTKHCLRYQFGYCSKNKTNPKEIKLPLFLANQNKKYALDFDCQKCEMKIKLI